MKIQYSPSMMCADFFSLSHELDMLKQEQVEWLHIDIMDGQYVPNFTLGPDLAYQMHQKCGIPLDFHLMIEDVDRSLALFTRQPDSIVTFHPETSRHPLRTIQQIRDMGCRPGIAIDPSQTIDQFRHLLPLVDQACIMTVNPGYSGQRLIPFCVDKMAELSAWKKDHHPELRIEVDGNVSWENIPNMVRAGAGVLVLGTSSVFTAKMSRPEAYQKLNDLIKQID